MVVHCGENTGLSNLHDQSTGRSRPTETLPSPLDIVRRLSSPLLALIAHARLVFRYKNLHEIVDLLFPPMDSFSASENYSFYTYWREEPVMDSVEDEMRKHLEDLAKRQKSSKSNGKQKSVAAVPTLAASTTPTTGTLPKTTPTTTVLKPGGEKLLTIAQATENTVKRA